MNKRTLLSLAPVALLSACGFRLRGVPEFGFGSLYIVAPASSPLARELQRTLDGSGSQLKVLRDPASMPTAEAIFDLLQEQQERVVVGLNASGQVRELQLRLRIKFRLRTPTGVELIPDTELLQQRDISYNETIALAKEAEEALIYRDMRTDLVQQLMRRLAAASTASCTTAGWPSQPSARPVRARMAGLASTTGNSAGCPANTGCAAAHSSRRPSRVRQASHTDPSRMAASQTASRRRASSPVQRASSTSTPTRARVAQPAGVGRQRKPCQPSVCEPSRGVMPA